MYHVRRSTDVRVLRTCHVRRSTYHVRRRRVLALHAIHNSLTYGCLRLTSYVARHSLTYGCPRLTWYVVRCTSFAHPQMSAPHVVRRTLYVVRLPRRPYRKGSLARL